MDATANRRAEGRHRTIKAGEIVFNNAHCKLSCGVVNMSSNGARLETPNAALCPLAFDLELMFEAPRRCQVVWRTPNALGVRFVDE
jgi:hypothetical protein